MLTDRLLLGPGPSNPYPEATSAFTRPLLGHMDPEFLAVMDETMARLRTVFRTSNALTLPVSGTGSAGMEACFVNLLEPGDTAIIGANGVFGDRMCEVARRCGAEVVRIDEPWGKPLDPQRLLDAQAQRPDARLVAVVHAETSTGVENDVAPLRAPGHRHPSRRRHGHVAGGHSRRGRRMGDRRQLLGHAEVPRCAARSVAGHVLTARRRTARATRDTATVVVPRPVADREVRRWVGARLPPHRADRDGVRAPRRARCGARRGARAGVGASPRGGRPPAAHAARARFRARRRRRPPSPQLTTAWLPAGADDAALRGALLGTYGIEVGGGLGEFAGKAWRIGLMGNSARERSVTTLLGALRRYPRDFDVASTSGHLRAPRRDDEGAVRSMCSR